jgi:hypothetical protein
MSRRKTTEERFLGKELTQHATFAIKSGQCQDARRRGVILVNDSYPHHTPREDQHPSVNPPDPPMRRPVLQVKESTAEAC